MRKKPISTALAKRGYGKKCLAVEGLLLRLGVARCLVLPLDLHGRIHRSRYCIPPTVAATIATTTLTNTATATAPTTHPTTPTATAPTTHPTTPTP